MKYFKRMLLAQFVIICTLFLCTACDEGSSKEDQVSSSDKTITSFNIPSPASVGDINESAKTISISLPFGTGISSLVPVINHTGASISPASGVAQNFENPVLYTVTAEDGSTQSYIVSATAALSDSKAITSFSFGIPGEVVIINEGPGTIFVTLPYNTLVTSLAPVIGITGDYVNPASGAAREFTNPVAYEVTAADSTTKEYTVTVTVTSLPSIKTVDITESPTYAQYIKGISSRACGNVINEGASAVTQRGLCWNTAGNPTISTDSYSNSGTGTGVYYITMGSLTENTIYHVRAYAINTQGITYGNEISFNSGWIFNNTVRFGGYVFYNDGNGGGLVCATEDQNISEDYYFEWSIVSIDENGDNSSVAPELQYIGSGQINSQYIYDTYGPGGTNTLSNFPAFYACYNYSDGTYSDWFLPSYNELSIMLINQGGLFEHTDYWSSSEYSSGSAYYIYMVTGASSGSSAKSLQSRVRAVRAF